jgi:leader peptidase (prepilin peptidase)/N-methyltransferase
LVMSLLFVFVLGTVVGSFLNVCVYRLPYEKSLVWPGSRCGNCYQPISILDNVPLVSYWLLRGKCRKCGASFSPRYFIIEALTGLCFAGLFYLELIANVYHFDVLKANPWFIRGILPPFSALGVFGFHAILLCFLLVVSFVDLEHFEIPLPITITGTLVGLIGSVLMPWPWPNEVIQVPRVAGAGGLRPAPVIGAYPWPVWETLPAWLGPVGDWKSGLATGIAGMLAGMLMLRGIRFVFGLGRGKEGLGIGDADLMMMAGAFVGWQPIVVAFFVSVFPALFAGLLNMIIRGTQETPFGPSLAAATLATLLGWHWIGPAVHPLFTQGELLFLVTAGGAFFLLLVSYLLRLTRR